jgi:hypothetical protein
MSIDWNQLIRVRERQQMLARQTVARDRQEEQKSAAALMKAHAGCQETMAVKAAHWQSTTRLLGEGGCRIDQLRDAGAWSQALNGQVARARSELRQAQAQYQEELAVLEKSQAQLRAAAAELQKAQEMQKREGLGIKRKRELRMDESAEESATRIWSVQHLAGTSRA